MSRNNNSLGWKLSVAKNTEYTDSVQMKALHYYVQLNPPPVSKKSGLVLVRSENGIDGLFEMNRNEIFNYFEGLIRGFRKKFMKLPYVDIYETLYKAKDYDLDNKYGLYKYKTFKNKAANLCTSFNRKMQLKHSLYQKAGTLNEHWKNPPYIKMGKDVESLSCKKVCKYVHHHLTNVFLYILLLIYT